MGGWTAILCQAVPVKKLEKENQEMSTTFTNRTRALGYIVGGVRVITKTDFSLSFFSTKHEPKPIYTYVPRMQFPQTSLHCLVLTCLHFFYSLKQCYSTFFTLGKTFATLKYVSKTFQTPKWLLFHMEIRDMYMWPNKSWKVLTKLNEWIYL